MEELSRLLTDNVVFPEFGFSFNLDKEAFSVFGFSVKWYGLLIAIGLLLAVTYCFRRLKEFGLEEDRMIDVVPAGLVGAVIGARLYYVVLHPENFKDFTDILAIRDGGLAIYGGVIGALLLGCLMARFRKLRILPVLDIASMGFLIGQSIGRWGNFFNQEAFGTNTELPWGMSGGRIQNYLIYYQAELAEKGIEVNPFLPVHPCFLYESLWCIAGFVILHFYHKKRKFDGEIFCMYLVWYGIGRFFIEGLRIDSLYIGSIRASQALALISAVIGIALIIIMRVKNKKHAYILYRDSEESKAMLAAAEKEMQEYEERRKAKKAKKQELSEDQKIVSDDEDDTE